MSRKRRKAKRSCNSTTKSIRRSCVSDEPDRKDWMLKVLQLRKMVHVAKIHFFLHKDILLMLLENLSFMLGKGQDTQNDG
jgi:hypothetical protein